ncbi:MULTISPECIES: esterase-like activity of phytase family protein [Aphanothece]|uniref:esterase-like activity of phytase family protein n=1 Tax=Aphanothece TaxID=1121 RepID=UPI0039853CFE
MATPFLPCPLSAGWELVAQAQLPRADAAGLPQGGFSAAAVVENELWLLSDAPQGRLQRWQGLDQLGVVPLRPAGSLPLPVSASGRRDRPASLDGEGLVLRGNRAWVVSEGRRQPERLARLLAFDRADGRLLASLPLPEAWLENAGQGLQANGGPESLTVLPALPGRRMGPAALLAAAELPLLQDPPDRVRLAALPLSGPGADTPGQPGAPGWRSLRPLRLPGEGWGLTELLALPQGSGEEPAGLLALFRRFEPPLQWQVRLALFPMPRPMPLPTSRPMPGEVSAADPPLEPLASWDLPARGLPPDNWEAMAWRQRGPGLPPQLLLASDDNFNPLQANHLALLQPRRSPTCAHQP